jgi:hypothetical protein
VVATGESAYGQCQVSDWTDIVAISTGDHITVGLKRDGTVVATGGSLLDVDEVKDWRNIAGIAAGDDFIIGLKADGTVISVGQDIVREIDGQGYDPCGGVRKWKDIVAISAGRHHTVGLKSDGTVVAVGYNGYGQCEVSNWKDIVEIAAGEFHTIGKKRDGSLIAIGYNSHGQCDLSNVGKDEKPEDGGNSGSWPAFDSSKLKIESAVQSEWEEEAFWGEYFTSTISFGNQKLSEHTQESEFYAFASMNRVSAGSSILLNDIYKQYQKNTSGNAMSQEKWKATYGNYDIVSAAVMVECGPNVDGYTLFGGQFRLGLLDLDTGKTFMVIENGQYIHSTLKGTQDVYLIASISEGTMEMGPGEPETNYVEMVIRFLVPAGYDDLALYVGYSDPAIEDDLAATTQAVGFYYDTPGCKKETLFVRFP